MIPLLRGESCTEPNVNFAQPRTGVGKNNTQAARGHRLPMFTVAANSRGWGPPTSSAAVCGSSPSPCSPSLQQRTAQSTSPQHGVNRRRNPVQDSLDVPGGNECVPNEKGECTPKPREVLPSVPELWGIASSAECGDGASTLNTCPWPSVSKSLAEGRWQDQPRRVREMMRTSAKVTTCPALPRTFPVWALKVLPPRKPSVQGKPGRWVP